jgi:hypothetical protein
MLTLAGRAADIVGISAVGGDHTGFTDFDSALGGSASRIEEQLAWVERGAGRRFDDLVIGVFAHHLQVVDDVPGSASALAAEWETTPDQVLASPHVLLGDTSQIIETLQERRERFRISYIVFLGADLANAEPIVSALAGT